MDRSWLLCMPPQGMTAYVRRTRVGRLRHQGDRLWLDLQAGSVEIDLSQPVEVTYGRWDDDGQVWIGAVLRQGDVRLSLQSKAPPTDKAGDCAVMDLDGPSISYDGFRFVMGLLGDKG